MNWSFRSIALGCSAALMLVVALLTTALVLSTTRLHNISFDLMTVSNSLRVTQELEANILVHSRESLLWNLTQENVHLNKRDRVKNLFETWLGQSANFGDSPEELEQLNNVKKTAETYFSIWAQFEREKAPAVKIANSVSPYTDGLLAELRKFSMSNLAQAQSAQQAAVSTKREVVTIGTFAILTSLIGLTLLILLLRRHIYVPLRSMALFIKHLERDAKLPPIQTKVHDVSTIWHALDDFSQQLHRRKETQLRYLAAVAHDLRNPIGAIAAGASYLSEAEELPEDLVEITQVINRQVGYLNVMVSDLLNTTRAEGGRLTLNLELRDLRLAVIDAVNLFRGYSKMHVLVFDAPEISIICRYDPTRISQVLNNLVSNAIKYTPYGGVIHVALAKEDNMAVVRIIDPGIGVSEQELHSIFEPFRRSSSTVDTIPGVGLGLFTSQKIIASHGGSISVESVKGVGATFIVGIPIL